MPRWHNRLNFVPRSRRFLSRRGQRLFVTAFVLYFLLLVFIFCQLKSSPRNVEKKSSVEPVQSNDAPTNHQTLVEPFPPQAVETNEKKKVAFVGVITNEDFVDGSLVVGYSLRQQSTFAKNGSAELVLIFPTGALSEESQQRLQCAGWQHLLQLPDLSTYVPKARLGDTFNKLYIFNLTQYSRVALFDGDMLIMRNPDEVFMTELPNERYIGAIGSRHRLYFQTGMMLVIPSTAVFLSLIQSLSLLPADPHNDPRDGILIRQYFHDRYVRLDHMLSIHIRPRDESLLRRAIGVHYPGGWKPWHRGSGSGGRSTRRDAAPERGAPFRLWWSAYEQLHAECLRRPGAADDAPRGYDPARDMWLMRHTAQSYRTARKRSGGKGMGGEEVHVVRSAKGESCDAACVTHSVTLQCVESALRLSTVNAAEVLRRQFGCEGVEVENPAPHQPSYNVRTRRCHVNALDRKWQRPTCMASDEQHRRLCACVDGNDLQRHPEPQNAVAEPHPKEESALHEWKACAAWLPGRTDKAASQRCASQLAQWHFVTHVESIPRQLGARTIKVLLHYPNGLRALGKLEQASFPLEPHAEYGAYMASLLLGVNLVPPTTLLRVPRAVLRRALLSSADKSEKRFLQRELDWLRRRSHCDTVDNCSDDESRPEKTVLVSAQLWLTGDVVDFAHATPPLTVHRFNEWLRAGTHRTDVAKGNTTLMEDVAAMIFFDYVIGNDDRSFTHNAYVFMRTRVVLLDQGKSLCSASEPDGNILYRAMHRNHRANSENTGGTLFCRLPAPLLSRALRFSRSSHIRRGSLAALAEGERVLDGRSGLDGRLLRSRPPGDVTWQILEDDILAVQMRLEQALQHFAQCAEMYGLLHVTGNT